MALSDSLPQTNLGVQVSQELLAMDLNVLNLGKMTKTISALISYSANFRTKPGEMVAKWLLSRIRCRLVMTTSPGISEKPPCREDDAL
ncbi:hypothetical protein TNCV_647191 [Trichonephila clavipes]|uniref:Uncharacterized protein n=1 Tax=Trichonephila clavipes TaxID=2585209 RepID=A0A8X6VPJ9_TRICX|nr:hypothetical protein TNCV_647191 [Trichonephila clavipes]